MNKKGFTLVELLASIVIIAIIRGIGVVAVGYILETDMLTLIPKV